ncbi:hypothetical protein HDU98_009283 [Podochytrium sp. JEL0797]|nr:hypothetical protein HDU98_009283 [Podochytrium sp. JEL0797]
MDHFVTTTSATRHARGGSPTPSLQSDDAYEEVQPAKRTAARRAARKTRRAAKGAPRKGVADPLGAANAHPLDAVSNPLDAFAEETSAFALPFFGRGNATLCSTVENMADGPPIPLRKDGRRKRVHPTSHQLAMLEDAFNKNPLPTKLDREAICAKVNINSRSVQIWFQNQRAKMRRSEVLNVTPPATRPPPPEKIATKMESPFILLSPQPAIPDCSLSPLASSESHFSTEPCAESLLLLSLPLDSSNTATDATEATDFLYPTPILQIENSPPASHFSPLEDPHPTSSLHHAFAPSSNHFITLSEANIGTWRRISNHPNSLTCEISPLHGYLRLSILEEGFTFQLEIPLMVIVDASIVHAPEDPFTPTTPTTPSEPEMIILLDLCSAPVFYRELPNEQGHPTGFFAPSADFSQDAQASQCLRHELRGSASEMEKLFLSVSGYFEGLGKEQAEQQMGGVAMQCLEAQYLAI